MRGAHPLSTKSFLAGFFLLLTTVAARIFHAQTASGLVYGGLCGNPGSPSQFLGIPYAIPPVGRLRWKAPLKYNRKYHGGRLIARKLAPVCYQYGGANGSLAAPPPYSEDCLYLNVWVPRAANISNPGLPVKVWIHGGANTGGSIANPLYNGCDLAAGGTVVVGVAYRLGPLGFLALESAGIKGNFGIQDIVLALQWVQQNIAGFGGDPNKVLLFGQSAGAWDSFIVSTLPGAKKLMRAVALSSGGGISIQNNTLAQRAGAIFAERANCSVTDEPCLRALSPSTMREVFRQPGQVNLRFPQAGRPSIQPFVDGHVIPQQPSQAGVQVPAMFSTMSHEGTKFMLGTTHGDPRGTKVSHYHRLLAGFVGPLINEVYDLYPISNFRSHQYPQFERAAKIVTDRDWLCPAYRGLLRAAEKGIPAWTVLFDHIPSCPIRKTRRPPPVAKTLMIGATHSLDLPFILGHTSWLPRPGGRCKVTPEERHIGLTLVDAWTGLAERGNASTVDFEWPKFENGSWLGAYVGWGRIEVQSLEVDYSVCEFWGRVESMLTNREWVKAGSNATYQMWLSSTSSVGIASSSTSVAEKTSLSTLTTSTTQTLSLSISPTSTAERISPSSTATVGEALSAAASATEGASPSPTATVGAQESGWGFGVRALAFGDVLLDLTVVVGLIFVVVVGCTRIGLL